jgi:hypothetical protein
MRFFLIGRVIYDDGLYAYNIHNIEEKHFSISIAHVRSRGGLLVINIKSQLCIARRAIAKTKQRSQSSVIGWVTNSIISSRWSGCICSQHSPIRSETGWWVLAAFPYV